MSPNLWINPPNEFLSFLTEFPFIGFSIGTPFVLFEANFPKSFSIIQAKSFCAQFRLIYFEYSN